MKHYCIKQHDITDFGFANKTIVEINKTTSKIAPAGTPNPYYIWTMF